MIRQSLLLFLILALPLTTQAQLSGDRIPTSQGALTIHPIAHATFAMEWQGHTIYVDPVGGAEAFEGLPAADLILVTDIHGDHFDLETLRDVAIDAEIIAPLAVTTQINGLRATSMANGDTIEREDISIEAIPMYNLTPDRLQYHEEGRGNGYVLTFGDKRVYISGDTEDIPEMRNLEDIDVAFVCFNLPFTMTPDQAADAVNDFRPDIVYPYHYRGSDMNAFTSMVEGVEVRQRDWY